ncbi:MAG: NAD-dependent epimerase/dehydratase family protein [Chitinophagaceae bacterium]
MATVLITGGTGTIGKAITNALLEKKYEVIVLTRKLPLEQPVPGLSYAQWNIEQPSIDAEAISKADHIIHLAGANVAEKRWTKKRKKEIIDSRVKSGELLVGALKEIPNKIKSVISASAIGWYGADGEKPGKKEFVETDLSSNDFLGQPVSCGKKV